MDFANAKLAARSEIEMQGLSFAASNVDVVQLTFSSL